MHLHHALLAIIHAATAVHMLVFGCLTGSTHWQMDAGASTILICCAFKLSSDLMQGPVLVFD